MQLPGSHIWNDSWLSLQTPSLLQQLSWPRETLRPVKMLQLTPAPRWPSSPRTATHFWDAFGGRVGVGSWAQPSASALSWSLKVAVSLRSCMCLLCVQASKGEPAREKVPKSAVQASCRTAMPTLWTQPPETSRKFFLLPVCKGGQGERPSYTPLDKKHKPNQGAPPTCMWALPGSPVSPGCPQLDSSWLQLRTADLRESRPHSQPSSAAWLLLMCLATVEKSLVAKPPPLHYPSTQAVDFAFEVIPNDNTVIGTKPALLRRDIFPPVEHNWDCQYRASRPQNLLSWPVMGWTFFFFHERTINTEILKS